VEIWTPNGSPPVLRQGQRGFAGYSIEPAGPEGFTYDAARFDGSTYLTRVESLPDVTDSNKFTFSCWALRSQAVSNYRLFNIGGPPLSAVRLVVQWTGAGKIFFFARDSSGTQILNYSSSGNFLDLDTWIHILASFDLSDSNKAQLYINNFTSANAPDAYTDGNIDFNVAAGVSVGDTPTGSTGQLNGALAELAFWPGVWVDLTGGPSRDAFGADGVVDMGADASLPTGVPAAVYLHLDENEAPANFALNRATGWDLTISGTSGVLTTASTKPPSA
jgi:hypothetical protein